MQKDIHRIFSFSIFMSHVRRYLNIYSWNTHFILSLFSFQCNGSTCKHEIASLGKRVSYCISFYILGILLHSLNQMKFDSYLLTLGTLIVFPVRAAFWECRLGRVGWARPTVSAYRCSPKVRITSRRKALFRRIVGIWNRELFKFPLLWHIMTSFIKYIF